MHEWISVCLPEVPNRADDDDGEVELFFRNAFLGRCVHRRDQANRAWRGTRTHTHTHTLITFVRTCSFLSCKYGDKEAVFKSDSISTIAILKEVKPHSTSSPSGTALS